MGPEKKRQGLNTRINSSCSYFDRKSSATDCNRSTSYKMITPGERREMDKGEGERKHLFNTKYIK